jgi:hypothetical protein
LLLAARPASDREIRLGARRLDANPVTAQFWIRIGVALGTRPQGSDAFVGKALAQGKSPFRLTTG